MYPYPIWISIGEVTFRIILFIVFAYVILSILKIYRTRIWKEGNTLHLSIESLQSNDSGKYTCFVSNHSEIVAETFVLVRTSRMFFFLIDFAYFLLFNYYYLCNTFSGFGVGTVLRCIDVFLRR